MTTLSKKQNIGNRDKFYKIEEIGAHNQFFTKVKIYIMHEGKNRNGSDISREAIDKAIPTLFNIPIVGNYLEEEENFSNHAMRIEKDNNNKKVLVSDTVPYGVVPESAEIYWEKVVEDNGEEKDYLVVDGALLWTGRYSQLLSIYDEGYFNQSMEIYMNDYSYKVSGGKEVLEIYDFTFTGLCLLGVSKESDIFGHEEPAFNQGKVMTYSLESETFSSQFKEMIRELQYTLNEGDEKVEDITLELDPENVVKISEGKITVEAENIVLDNPEDEATKTQTFEKQIIETVEKEKTTTIIEDGEVVDELKEVKLETTIKDVSTDKKEDRDDERGRDERYVLKTDYDALSASHSTLQTELFQLREYKRDRELGDLRFKFEGQLSEVELNELFEAKKDADISSLELEIFALIGKTNFSLNSTANRNKEVNKASVLSPKQEEKEYNPYGDIKFLK